MNRVLIIVTIIATIAGGVYAVDAKYATKQEVVQSMDQFYDKLEMRELYRRKDTLETERRNLRQIIRANEAMSMTTFDAQEDLKSVEDELKIIKEKLNK